MTSRHFRIVGADQTGRRVRTELLAQDPASARQQMRKQGIEVHHLGEVRGNLGKGRISAAFATALDRWRCSHRQSQRAELFDGLAALLKVGIPLENAFRLLEESATRPQDERRLLSTLRDAITSGTALHDAAAGCPGWFDVIDVAMLRAGTESGDLPRILGERARSHQGGIELTNRLVAALAYPAFLAFAAVVVTLFLSQTTLPQLLKMLADAKIPPPLVTVLVADAGRFVIDHHVVLALLAVGLAVGGSLLWPRLTRFSRIQRTLHNNPFGRSLLRMDLARCAGILSLLLRSGIPLDEALGVAAQAMGARRMGVLLTNSQAEVRRGGDLSRALEGRRHQIDAEFIQLVRTGEQTGELGEILGLLAERYERLAFRSVQRLAALLEPLAIVILASAIGVIVFATILPILAMEKMI